MKKLAETWFKVAQLELNAASTLYKDGNYLKCVEHCHAALEKMLKCIITEKDKRPSKVHDLLVLVGEAVIGNLQGDIKTVLDDLGDLYLSVRYPEDLEELYQRVDKDRSEYFVKETKRIFKWLEKKVK